ncbi:MAG: FG-GAP-like repeat-containing protein [Planctomycetota bacterium]
MSISGLAFLCLSSLTNPTQAQTQIHVSPSGSDVGGDGSSGNPYKTISHAASVAPSGATLLLSSGTFGDDEQILLGTKDLTIVGSGTGSTVVRPHPTLVHALPRGFPSAPFLEDHRCVFTVEGAHRVDIRSLTVDCAFRTPSTGRLTGIYYRDGADGTVQDVEITNCRTNPLNGIQGPAAAIVRGDGVGDTCNVTFRQCFVHDWGKGGIVAYFDTALTVEQCTVTGMGRLDVPLPAQNCLQLTYGAVGLIRNNTISDSSYIPNTYGASGMLLFDAGAGTVVEGNDVVRCEGSIWVVSSVASTTPITIRGNTATACYGGGLWVQDTSGLVVDGNTFGMSLSTDIPVYDDASPPNAWSNNRYSDNPSGAAPYAIDGGTSSDATAVAGCRGFGASSSTALGTVPVELVALQLDGSGGRDFVTVNEGSTPSLSVGLESSGSYAVSSLAFGSSGGRAVSIVSGQFDGSGGTDIAVLTVNNPPATGENKVYVFSNTGGVLGLLHTETLSSVFASSDLAVGDIDGDGVDDLAVADLGTIGVPGSVTVLLNGGTGTSWSSSSVTGFTTQCVCVGTGDLDGDGHCDLAVAEGNGSTGRVHTLLGDGAGNFSASPLGAVTIPSNPSGLAVADLDLDGRPDIVVCSYGAALPLDSGAVTVLRNRLPSSFAVSITPTDRGPVHVAIGDLDADDDPDTLRRDAVVTDFVGGTVTVCGEYSSSSNFSSGMVCSVGSNPRACALADMDGDGFGDLIVADAGAQAVLVVHGSATARVDLYGAGCAGTADRIPVIAAVGAPALPQQPNPTFGIECRDARPLSVGVLNASFAPGPSLSACNLLLASIDVSWVQFTNSVGTARVSIPLPSTPPALHGAALYFQWAIIDPQGDLFGFIALSNGLKIRIGS